MTSGYGGDGGGYQQYGGNPYGNSQESGYGTSNPYASESEANPYGQSASGGYGSSNPYGASSNPYGGAGVYDPTARPAASHQPSAYSATSDYGRTQPADYTNGQYAQAPAVPELPGNDAAALQAPPTAPSGQPMSNPDFLARVEAVRNEIRTLTSNISEVGTIHQRVLSNPDPAASTQLESIVASTQILNTKIKDQIKQLEVDAARSGRNQTKDSQIRTLKSNFKSQLEEYQKEEMAYRQRYRDQIERQYRIVNPEATEAEVREAADADWGNEGVFQTALKSNRTGAAQSVLGSVRQRHNDIQKIEQTLIELGQLFQDLAEAVVLQDAPIQQTEQQAEVARTQLEDGNRQLDSGIKSATRARKLRKWCFIIIILIICIIALVVGLVVGLQKAGNKVVNGQ